MIIFKTVTWQNFLSTGNTPIEIVLNNSPSTLIIGDNGSGKSTVLDALTFGLFGKPFRRIKKDQLVNSVNGRDCTVEILFTIGRKKFVVKRGIKPTKFEIYIDDKLLNQDASARDYQKHLENNILKLNHRSFTQVVVLGSSSFIPFMQLTAASRREVVEEILDIKIFSLMNFLLKHQTKGTTERSRDISYEQQVLDTKIKLTEDHITKTKEKGKISLSALEKKIEKNNKEVETLQVDIATLLGEFSEWETDIKPKHLKLESEIKEYGDVRWKLNLKIKKAKKEIDFFMNNDECPTCEQPIANDFKEMAIEQNTNKMITTTCSTVEMDRQIDEMHSREQLYKNISNDSRDKEVSAAKKSTSKESIESFNQQLMEQINAIHSVDKELEADKSVLQVHKEDFKKLQKEGDKALEQLNYYKIAKQLLQDSGIKTKIIKQYLPIMNKLVNSYLNQLEFQVKFELDDEFNEMIRSRYRDEFSYANFSEGEKMRIDLALLFTWRQIAKMKNSTNTNLLVLDEIFDSSLDVNGTDEFLKILNTLSDENIFLISHKTDLNIDKFDSLIKFEKVQNFTRIVS